ncbi:glycosyltransferase [Ectothiorhodospiraceae bacterium BW-2]|nr:glycosyltransferase [Ectothiorhodospiraceae bacterium BW-2]
MLRRVREGYVEAVQPNALSGWVARRADEKITITLTLFGQKYPLQPEWYQRSDVADKLGEEWSYGGFVCALLPWQYYIIARYKQRFKWLYANNDSLIIAADALERQSFSAYAASYCSDGFVEDIQANAIYGWVKRRGNSSINLWLNINDSWLTLQVAWLPRVDIAKQFGKSYLHSGFCCRIKYPWYQELLQQARVAKLENFHPIRVNDSQLLPVLKLPFDLDSWLREFINKQQPSLQQISDLTAANATPKFSVIVPVYNTKADYLQQCIESVLAQVYPYWELCVADDASTDVATRTLLTRYQEVDNRIKVVFRTENGHISVASNSALQLATGDYMVLLDHDDQLTPDALYHLATVIQQRPTVKLLYSDEDKVSCDGGLYQPHFKSEWNRDLFYSHNYLGHLVAIERRVIELIGGFRPGVEGSQDYDLILRTLQQIDDSEIEHISYLLYHWRSHEESTAASPDAKQYTQCAGIKALSDYFNGRYSQTGRVTAGIAINSYHIIWPLPDKLPLVSLIIATRDRVNLLKNAIESLLFKTIYENYEIIIIDNGSVEKETLHYFEQITEKKNISIYRHDVPFNFSLLNNLGVQYAKGEVIGLINNDIEVINSNWLTEMVSHAMRPDIGCVGAKLYYSNNTIQHGGVILGIGGVAGHAHKYFPKESSGYFDRLNLVQNCSAVTAACLLVRKEIYQQVGGLDEENLKIAFNDVDFCLKVREAGYRNLWTPYAELYHHESLSRGEDDTPEKRARFESEVRFMQHKWGDILQNDPYYSPYLTRQYEDFSLAID